jgi:hypothetical protein
MVLIQSSSAMLKPQPLCLTTITEAKVLPQLWAFREDVKAQQARSHK